MNGIELFCSKKVYNSICRLCEKTWQEIQYDYRTLIGVEIKNCDELITTMSDKNESYNEN